MTPSLNPNSNQNQIEANHFTSKSKMAFRHSKTENKFHFKFSAKKSQSETSPLIRKKMPQKQRISKWKFKFVEPLPVIYMATAAILEPVIQQYVYLRISENFGNKKVNTSKVDELTQLCDINRSSPAFLIQQRTQSTTSQYLMFFTIVQVLLCCPMILILGSVIDKMGRKIALYMTFSSRLFHAIIVACVIGLDLPIQLLFLGFAIDGICGTIEAAMMACNSYIADVTSPGKQRAFRMTVLEAVLGLTSGTASAITGFLIRHTTFLTPILIVLALLVVGLIYAVFFLAESNDASKVNNQMPRMSFELIKSSLKHYIRDTPDKRRTKLLLALVGGFFTAPIITASSDVLVLYVLNSPNCWTPDHIGNFSAAQIYSRCLVALTLVKLLQRYLSDVDIVILGIFSNGLAVLILAFARDNPTIYLSAIAGVFAYVALPNIRSAMSKLVKQEEIGSLFSGFYLMEAITTLLFGIVYNMVYAATLDTMRGIVFLLMASMLLLALCIFIVYKILVKKSQKNQLVLETL